MKSDCVVYKSAARVCCGLAVFGGATPAFAQSSTNADATIVVGGGYATNPFMGVGSDLGSAFADIDVTPRLSMQRERASVTASLNYHRTQYARSYDGNDAFQGQVSGSYQLSQRANYNASVQYQDSILTAGDIFGVNPNLLIPVGSTTGTTGGADAVPIVAPDPSTGIIGVDPSLGDAVLIGSRQRRRLLSASMGLGYTLSARDSVSINVSGSKSTYPASITGVAQNYRQYSIGTSYSRTLSETRTIGASASFSDVDYAGNLNGSRVFSPQLTLSQKLSDRWSINASAGASIISQKGGGGTNTSLAFTFGACRAADHSSLCLTASRSAAASGIEGVRPQTSVGVSYYRQLSEKTSVNAGANYSRSGGGSLAGSGANNFFYGNVGLQRRLDRRFSLVATAAVQGVDSSPRSRPADISGRIGLSFSLDNRR